jgi:hypothetical protein
MREEELRELAEHLGTLARKNKEAFEKLMQYVNEILHEERTSDEDVDEEQCVKVKELSFSFLRDLMEALKKNDKKDINSMKKELLTFLEKAPVKYRQNFVFDIWYAMSDWARALSRLEDLKTELKELLYGEEETPEVKTSETKETKTSDDAMEKIKKAGAEFLREMMKALQENRKEDVDKMKLALEYFLGNASVKDRTNFGYAMLEVMSEWSKDLGLLDRLANAFEGVLLDKFVAYYEWIEKIEKKLDALDEAFERWLCR